MWNAVLAILYRATVPLAVLFRIQGRKTNSTPFCTWTVSIEDGVILTGDGLGTEYGLSVADLRKVVVATDDSGPWGYDVMYLLYAAGSKPAALFPLEARGCQDFVDWLSRRPG